MYPWRQFLTQSTRRAITVLAFLAGTLAGNVSAQSPVVRVGVYSNAPNLVLTDNGRPGGILGELLQEMAGSEGWELRAVPCEWEDCLGKLQTGDIDLLPDVHYLPERTRLYSFHQIPALHNWSQVYAAPDNAIRSVLDLEGKRVVAMSASSQHQFARTLMSNFGVHATLVGVPNQEEGFALVAAGQADAVVSSYYYGELHAAKHGIVATSVMFEPTRAFYASRKNHNQHLLDAIDKHLAAWQSNPSSVYFSILQQWGKPQPGSKIPALFWWGMAALVVLLILSLSITALLRSQVARQTRHIKAREIWLNTILESVDAFIYIKDKNLRYKYCNRKAYDFLGLHPEEMIGYTDSEVFRNRGVLVDSRQSDQRILEKGERVVTEEGMSPSLEGNTVRARVTVKLPLLEGTGEISGICGISTDITELQAAREAVHQLAYYDPLTKLPNRQLLLAHLERALAAAKNGQFVSAVLFIDLDDFKKLNDARGHLTGDTLLRSVGQRLKGTLRPYDTVARIGGDEFIVLLTRLGSKQSEALDKALYIAEKTRLALAQPFELNSHPFWSSASIGVALLESDQKSSEDILREADTAMYQSKENGRNQVSLYEASMQSAIEERLQLEHDIVQAINSDQLQMHLQSQFNPDNEMIGAELLMRWLHPERGLVSPCVFIPIAEKTGAIIALGEWTLRQACLALLKPRLRQASYPLSINVSPRQFREPNFAQRVKEILQETGAPANRLIFEITEGVLIHDLQDTLVRMAELAMMGIRFSIDDFGTGYSNLSSLKRLPLYELKIDQSLTQDIPRDPDSTVIVRLILDMARQLGMQVVAEGVETREQAEFLIEHGCNALQGYMLMYPMPLNDWVNSAP